MTEHRVPRWITPLWLAFVITLTLAAIVTAVRLGSDLAQAVGFLVVKSIAIFILAAVSWLALYGLSILLEGLEYHKTHCDDSKHWASMGDFFR